MRIPFLYASPALTVFSCSAACEFASTPMQSPRAQRSLVSKLGSSGSLSVNRLRRWQHVFLGFCLLLRGNSAVLTHCTLLLQQECQVGRECCLLAPSSHLSTQQSTHLHPQIFNWSRGFGANPTHFCLTGRWIPYPQDIPMPAIPINAPSTLDLFLLEVCTKQLGA